MLALDQHHSSLIVLVLSNKPESQPPKNFGAKKKEGRVPHGTALLFITRKLFYAWRRVTVLPRANLSRSIIHAPTNQIAQAPTITTENHWPYTPSGENFSVAVWMASLLGRTPASENS